VSWRLGLVDSAWAGSPWAGATSFDLTKEIGFDSIDLFIGYDPAALSLRERHQLRTEVESAGLSLWSLLCTPLGLADFNDGVREYHIERAKRVVDLAVDTNAQTVMLCPGEYVFQQKLLPPEWEWNRLVDAVRDIARHAASSDLTVSIEILPFEFAFINSIESAARLLGEVDVAALNVAIDISHLWLRRIEPQEIAKLRGRIGQVHIADCDGQHHGDLPAGHGTTPFVPYLHALDEAGFEGTASVELEFAPNPEEMLDWVKAAYQGSANVLQSAGLRA
jgi:D-psicose/D-tagatose/L-ribulose 3-epimerase